MVVGCVNKLFSERQPFFKGDVWSSSYDQPEKKQAPPAPDYLAWLMSYSSNVFQVGHSLFSLPDAASPWFVVRAMLPSPFSIVFVSVVLS